MLSSKRLGLLPLAAVALLIAALLAPSANAAYIPPLSSTAQYKALVRFVDKLNGLANTPTTANQKDAFGDQLRNKHLAAVAKSTGLFNRARNYARADAKRAFKAGSRTIRRTEAGELAALRREYNARMNAAAATYQSELDAIADEFDNRETTVRKQIKGLRKQKAKATTAERKAAIQAAIDRRVDRLDSDAELEDEEIADRKAGYRKEKSSIRAAKAAASVLVQQDDDAAIERLRNDHRRIYNVRVRTLQGKRTNQLGDLRTKLEDGRSAIERMPVTG